MEHIEYIIISLAILLGMFIFGYIIVLFSNTQDTESQFKQNERTTIRIIRNNEVRNIIQTDNDIDIFIK